MFLLKQGDSYKIATQTSGYAEILDEQSVAATYRHSLHQAKTHIQNYEKTQICIFEKLHGSSCNKDTIEQSIIAPLNKKVAVLSAQATASDFELFFQQHAALETSFFKKTRFFVLEERTMVLERFPEIPHEVLRFK